MLEPGCGLAVGAPPLEGEGEGEEVNAQE